MFQLLAANFAGFVEYLDAYQDAGGELPTSVELADDVAGVRLMTLYQAKGLEYLHVFVPHLLEGEWPVRERDWGLFPRELLREAVPVGDLHTEEERRLLYVAITRARETLTLSTHGGPTSAKAASAFVAELRDEAGPELVEHDRTAALGATTGPATGEGPDETTEGANGDGSAEADPRGALALGASTSDEGYLSGTCTIGPAEVTRAIGPIGNTAATAR